MALWLATKNGSTKIIPSAENHGECPDVLHVDGQTEYSRCEGYALHLVGPAQCGVLWAVETEWSHHKGIGIEQNWCVWANHWRRNGHSTKRDTTKLSSSRTMLGHRSQERSRHTWKRWNGRSYPTRRTLQMLLLPSIKHQVKKWIDSWIASKDASFFRDSIQQLPERWKTLVDSDGQYFESKIGKYFLRMKPQIES